jgi:uncharacterized protein YfaS (alpha-2-macroglobulin family)
LYDASLDAFAPHNWQAAFGWFYTNNSRYNLTFQNYVSQLQTFVHNWTIAYKGVSQRYRYYAPGVAISGLGFDENGFMSTTRGVEYFGVANGAVNHLGRGQASGGRLRMARSEALLESAVAGQMPAGIAGERAPEEKRAPEVPAEPQPDLSQVSARKNLNETAFFYPHLTVDDKGVVRIEFDVPEALTKWKFLGFAHDAQLRTALLTDEAVTSKDLMVQPNPPRFLREGDVIEFTVKVTNQSTTRQTGSVRTTFANAGNDEAMDGALGNERTDQPFDIAAGQSTSLSWQLTVPDFSGVLTYKTVGATDRLSDGEEGFLPVLSRRILVTQSLPLPIRGPQTKAFEFKDLERAAGSDTLQSQSLTVQMTSNPAWYAVMALPYLMEYPYECSEQVFNRLYANTLARHIANSDPRIRKIFDQWRDTKALDSPLEKNEDLRNVLIAETPWLLEAKKESQARRDVGILFDSNRLNNETANSLLKLSQMQYSDGAWPWFAGGPPNDYITLYIATGFGRLRQLGTDIDVSAATKAVDRSDYWLDQIYREILRHPNQKDQNHLSPTICFYLYGRSFFLKDKPIDAQYRPAVDFFLGQAKKYWMKLDNRQSQGHVAIGLKRFGDLQTPQNIMVSIKERALSDEEMGLFWREGDQSWWWYHAPIESQALMMEAFDEVIGDSASVEECKVWLLKQKQTQNWKSTKATADAIYGLLLRGTNVLASDKLVAVKLAGVAVEPESVEAGTGFYERRFGRGEIKPEMAKIEVTKSDEGVAWGSVHWQYLEDMGKVQPHQGTPLKISKSLHLKRNTEQGPTLFPVNDAVSVGDELVVRVELRVDRAMEYVHLKDYRGSGTEPVNVLSQYQFRDGLAYYESTRDTASHFFIDYMPRGTYVFEYSVRIQHRGRYQTGIADLQCMYAPEFNSHSGSVAIEVQ